MSGVRTSLILLAAFLAVFAEASFSGLRNLLGAQIDLLPALMVCASLGSDIVTVTLLAVLGGLWFDTLSANPLGISILPLFLVGFLIYPRRSLILREQAYARFVLGAGASALAPLLTMLMLLSTRQPLNLGWGTLWQWFVVSLGGGLLTPVCCWAIDGLHRALTYRPVGETSFRADREIRRGRN